MSFSGSKSICAPLMAAVCLMGILAASLANGHDPAGFAPAIRAMEAEDQANPPPQGSILFTGSSTIRLWQSMVEDLAPLDVFERGFGGSTMGDLLFYADRVVLPYRPRAIVVYEGENDIAIGRSVDEVYGDYRAFQTKVHRALPDCRLYFISVKPSPRRWELWPQMRALNERLQNLANADERVRFVDLATPLLGSSGQPRPSLYLADGLHLSRAGYAAWRDALYPVLMQNEAMVTADSTQAKPNFLFIICDDLNDAIAGLGRIPSAVTPNLDRLRARGVTFLNGASNSPICMPARNALMSGLHPHTSRHYTLYDYVRENPALQGATQLPTYLRQHGFQTFGCGKVFHGGGSPDKRMDSSVYWDDFQGGSNYGPFPYDASYQRPIERIRIHPRQAWLLEHEALPALEEKYNDPYWKFDNGGMRFAFENGFAPLEDVPPGGWRHADGEPFRFESSDDRELLEDEKSAAFATDILSRDHDQPFFLAVGIIRPHTPLYVPQEYFDRFPPESLALPPIKEDELAEVSAALRDNRPYGRLRWEMLKPGGEKVWREWLQAYLASIAFVDDQVGKILDALDASPHADNTVIVFTSDNGYHMGDKDSLFKDTLWEGAARVPFIWAGPGIAQGETCEAPASLLDIYPTLVDLADLPNDPHKSGHGLGLDGYSLRSLLQAPGTVDPNRPSISVSGVRGLTGVHFSARSASHRYILCQNGEEELYDHRADPLEHHNLAADPAHASIKAELRAVLEDRLASFEAQHQTLQSQSQDQ